MVCGRTVLVMTERLSFEEFERLMSEDPDDRDIREAHGFTYDDDYRDRTLLCRNGCGLSYWDVAVNKVRECLSAPGTGAPGA